MQKLQVYYSPTQSNKQVVSILSSRLKQCEFILLPENPWMRIGELGRIEGKAAFIWGDGKEHGFSHPFTSRKVRLKANFDYHTDTAEGDDLFPTFMNHMACSKKTGAAIIVPEDYNPFVHVDPADRLTQLLYYTREQSKNYNVNEIALTVDCDGLLGFPVMKQWVSEFTPGPKDVIETVGYLREKIIRLDMGGLIERLPPFSFDADTRITVPTSIEAYQFVAAASSMPHPEYPQQVLDKVGSYAIKVYEKLLLAFVGEN